MISAVGSHAAYVVTAALVDDRLRLTGTSRRNRRGRVEMGHAHPVELDVLSIDDVVAVARAGAQVEVPSPVMARIEATREVIERLADSPDPPMACPPASEPWPPSRSRPNAGPPCR